MKKRTKLIIGAGLAAGVLYASKTENRQFVIGQVADTINKWTDDDYIINLGKPENVRDANMVDEGAMTSVQFYYDLRDKANKVN